jgi:hypothetical protein
MAGNLKTVTNVDNYKKIYDEGNVIFNKKTYSDLGDDLKDMFTGKDYGHTRRKRQEDKEAQQMRDRLESDAKDEVFYRENPYREYAKEVFRPLEKKYGKQLEDRFLSDQGHTSPFLGEFQQFPYTSGLLKSKEAVDKATAEFEEKTKKVLGMAGGGRVDDISRQVEDSLYQLKRQLGDIGSWWKERLGIKRRGGFQR